MPKCSAANFCEINSIQFTKTFLTGFSLPNLLKAILF